MSDLISREAAIEAICTHGTSAERDGQYVISLATAKQRAVDILESLPTIDLVKHGRWITTEYNDGSVLCECSYCGHKRPRDGLPINYCPNCGAKMKHDDEAY